MMLFPPTFIPGLAMIIGGGVASLTTGIIDAVIDKDSRKAMIDKAKEVDSEVEKVSDQIGKVEELKLKFLGWLKSMNSVL